MLIDVRKYSTFPLDVPENQEEKESRRLWAKLTEGIKTNNQELAADEKYKVEEQERLLRKDREDKHIEWKPRFFDVIEGDSLFKGSDRLDYNNPEEICKTLKTLFT